MSCFFSNRPDPDPIQNGPDPQHWEEGGGGEIGGTGGKRRKGEERVEMIED